MKIGDARGAMGALRLLANEFFRLKLRGLVVGPGVPAASRVRMYNVGIITPVYFPPGRARTSVASSSPSSSSPSMPHVLPNRAPVARSTALISFINRSRARLYRGVSCATRYFLMRESVSGAMSVRAWGAVRFVK